jgi:hypothetical protein
MMGSSALRRSLISAMPWWCGSVVVVVVVVVG